MSKQASAAQPAPAPAPPPAYGKAAMVDLVDEIDWSACEVLNGSGSLQNILKQGLRDQEQMLLESDADEQLLVTIAFKTLVKIESLQLTAPGDGVRLRSCSNQQDIQHTTNYAPSPHSARQAP